MNHTRTWLWATVFSSAVVLFFLARGDIGGLLLLDSAAHKGPVLSAIDRPHSGGRTDDSLEAAILTPAATGVTTWTTSQRDRWAKWSGLSLTQKLNQRNGDQGFTLERLRHVRTQPEDKSLRLKLEPVIDSVLQQHVNLGSRNGNTSFECGTTICVLQGLPATNEVVAQVLPQTLYRLQRQKSTADMIVAGAVLPDKDQTLLFIYTPDYVVTPPES